MGTDRELILERVSRRILAAGALALVVSTFAVGGQENSATAAEPVKEAAPSVPGNQHAYFEKVHQNAHRFRLVSPYDIAPPAVASAIMGSEVINGTGEAVGEVEAILVDAETGQVGLVLAALDAGDEGSRHVLAPIREIAMLGEHLVWLSHGQQDMTMDVQI